MKRTLITVAAALAGVVAPHASADSHQGGDPLPVEYCADGGNTLCAKIPHTIDFQATVLGYEGVVARDQRTFDNLAWQAFIALNWPADKRGRPMKTTIGEAAGAPRVWSAYPTVGDVFGAGAPICGHMGKGKPRFRMMAKGVGMGMETGEFIQPTGEALIDRNLNFAVYDVRIHPDQAAYFRGAGITTKAGQEAYFEHYPPIAKGVSPLQYPYGYYEDAANATGGSPGAMEIKTSWRILDKKRDRKLMDRFYVVDGVLAVDGKYTESGEPLCAEAKLGLTGMHIIQRATNTGNGSLKERDWLWMTFEHKDNAPLAANAQDLTDIDLNNLPKSCTAPNDRGTYSFFNAACKGCATNTPPVAGKGKEKYDYKWADKPPYAAAYATNDKYGTQVVRCWKILDETVALNAAFQKKLAEAAGGNSVWSNYMLISNQWQTNQEIHGAKHTDLLNGNIPRFLANTTMETYVQLDPKLGSCIECHRDASVKVNDTYYSTDFSFLPSHAK